jgi:hypothetical protein
MVPNRLVSAPSAAEEAAATDAPPADAVSAGKMELGEPQAAEPPVDERQAGDVPAGEAVSRRVPEAAAPAHEVPRAFQRPSPEASRRAALDVLLVFTIAAVGVAALFAGIYYFYLPHTWRAAFKPTPIKRKEEPPDTVSRDFADPVRFDIDA